MKIHLLSDLHLEFKELKGLPGGDILLLAGDIATAAHMHSHRTDKEGLKLHARFKDFFFAECAKYQRVFYIMGNHEHYQNVWEDTASDIRKFLEGSNVTFLDKETAHLVDDLHIWGATLWTNYDNDHPVIKIIARKGMNDYNLIKSRQFTSPYKTHKDLSVDQVLNEHNESMDSLTQALVEHPDRKYVVMTHMAPSANSCHPKYGLDNPLNHCYYTNLSEFVLNNPRIVAWVHGHTHDSFDYMIGNTRVLCNPRGYAHSQRPGQENALFNINFNFEV